MTAFDYTNDTKDFLSDYRKNIVNPRLDQGYDLVNQFGERYDRAYQMINPYYAEAYRDQSFYVGFQWDEAQQRYLADQNRSVLTFNYCMRLINLIEGVQRQNRLASRVNPMTDEQSYVADIGTDIVQHVFNHGDYYEKNSVSCKDSMVSGISWISPWMDYRDDPENGDIKFHIDSWNATIWDPFFYNRDMSDCNFFARRKYLSKPDVISLLPEMEDTIMRLSYGTKDNRFTYMPYARQGAFNRLMSYTEYWSKSWDVKDVLIDRFTGETTDWTGPKNRLRGIQEIFPNLDIVRKPVQSVHLGIIVENQLLYYGTDPYGINDYSFTPNFTVWEPSFDLYQWKMQGLIRQIRDSQLETNKRRSKMLDMLDSQAYPGFKAKTGAVENSASLFKSGQGPVLFMKPTANMGDVEQLRPSDIPPGHFELMNAFEKDMPNILGINMEMFGIPDNENIQTAALLSKMRANAGLVSLRRLTDGWSETQKIVTKKCLKMVQANWSIEKIAMVCKREVPQEFFSTNFMTYDIVVAPGVLTDTQQENQFNSLIALRTIGVEVSDYQIVKKSNIHDKQEILDAMDAKAKMIEEMEAKKQQLELEKIQVITDGIEAKAQSDQALASERLNKIHLDRALDAERIARAEQDKTAADLNYIKALKELNGMDIQDLNAKIGMLKQLSDIQMSHSQEARAKIEHEMAMSQPQQNTGEQIP